MFLSGDIDTLVKQMINQFGQGKNSTGQDSSRAKHCGGRDAIENSGGATGACAGSKPLLSLTPQRLLVIPGLLSGVLEVTSVLVDKDQTVQFVLSGNLKRPTRLDKMIDEIGKMPFDDVLRAVIDRLG